MNQYEIIYSHTNMPPDYRGMTHKWARDEKTARDFFKKKPYIKIVSVCEVPPTK